MIEEKKKRSGLFLAELSFFSRDWLLFFSHDFSATGLYRREFK